MINLTVLILTKNEEKNLRKCIESFRGIAKRFVIVDSFSTDETKALCNKLNEELNRIGAHLDFYQHEWKSYSDQFNWGLKNTDIDTEWTMRMDADEELMGDLALEIEHETNLNYVIKITEEEKAHQLLSKLVSDGIKVNKFEIKKPTLNDIFIEKVGEQK